MKTVLNLLGRLGLIAASTQVSATETSQSALLNVGTPLVVQSSSSDGKYGAVFEDDGETGYFYALDLSRQDNPILEALHIYNVKNVKDRDVPSSLRIVWSRQDRQAGLWINDYPHAIFDFSGQRAYSRNNFPAPSTWTSHDFSWDEKALEFFR